MTKYFLFTFTLLLGLVYSTETLALSLPKPPGLVFWDSQMGDPAKAGFSIKTENSRNNDPLKWAKKNLYTKKCVRGKCYFVMIGRPVDGVYFRGWGCGKALKVPGLTKVLIYKNGRAVQVRPILPRIGKPRFVYTAPRLPNGYPNYTPERLWPDCPL